MKLSLNFSPSLRIKQVLPTPDPPSKTILHSKLASISFFRSLINYSSIALIWSKLFYSFMLVLWLVLVGFVNDNAGMAWCTVSTLSLFCYRISGIEEFSDEDDFSASLLNELSETMELSFCIRVMLVLNTVPETRSSFVREKVRFPGSTLLPSLNCNVSSIYVRLSADWSMRDKSAKVIFIFVFWLSFRSTLMLPSIGA